MLFKQWRNRGVPKPRRWKGCVYAALSCMYMDKCGRNCQGGLGPQVMKERVVRCLEPSHRTPSPSLCAMLCD
jgi:hypothetical protein